MGAGGGGGGSLGGGGEEGGLRVAGLASVLDSLSGADSPAFSRDAAGVADAEVDSAAEADVDAGAGGDADVAADAADGASVSPFVRSNLGGALGSHPGAKPVASNSLVTLPDLVSFPFASRTMASMRRSCLPARAGEQYESR